VFLEREIEGMGLSFLSPVPPVSLFGHTIWGHKGLTEDENPQGTYSGQGFDSPCLHQTWATGDGGR